MNSRTDFDHYVTRYYIELFTNPNGKAYVGNIKTKEVTETDDFTKLLGEPNWSIDQRIEDSFGKAETAVAKALKRIKTSSKAVSGLADTTRLGLRDFMCIHAVRAKGLHDTMDQSGKYTQRELEKRAPSYIDRDSLVIPQTSRPESLAMGLEVAHAVQTTLKLRGCVAIMATDKKQFILGDNPLAILSTETSWQPMAMRGGYPSKKTYLWFPLNPKLGLFIGDGIGNSIENGPIKIIRASEKLCDTLNRAEVYLASEHLVGQSKGLVKGKLKLDNIGDKRAEVHSANWHPFLMMENKEFLAISDALVDYIKNQL